MTNQSLQTLSQIAVALGLILSALGGYGAYYYGKKVDDEKDSKKVINNKGDSLLTSKGETNINLIRNNGAIIGEQTNNLYTNKVSKERPIIDLCHRGITVDQINDTTAFFDIPYCSGKNANAFNVKLQTAVIVTKGNDLQLAAPFNEKFPDDITLTYETGKSISYKLFPYTKDMMSLTYIYVKGSFTNDDESKRFLVSDLYKYNTHLGIWQRTLGDENENVRAFLKSHNVL